MNKFCYIFIMLVMYLGILLISMSAAHAKINPQQQQLLKAELYGGKVAINIFEEMMSSKSSEVDVDQEYIKMSLIEAMLKEARFTKNPDYLTKSVRYIDDLQDTTKRFWANIMFIRASNDIGWHNLRNKNLRKAESLLKILPDITMKSYGAQALVKVMLETEGFLKSDLDKAHKLVNDYINTPWHEAAAVHDISWNELLLKNPEIERASQNDIAEKLETWSTNSIKSGRYNDAKRFINALPLSKKYLRQELSDSLAESLRKNGDANSSIAALSGIINSSEKSDRISEIVDNLIVENRAFEAEAAIKKITEKGKQASSWMRIAAYYRSKGYLNRKKQALEQAKISIEKMQKGKRQADRWATMAKIYAESGDIKSADRAVMKAEGSAKRPDAWIAIIKYLSDSGSPAQAENFLEPLEGNLNHIFQAKALIAKSYARKGDIDKSLGILESIRYPKGNSKQEVRAHKYISEAWGSVARYYDKNKLHEKSSTAIEKISNDYVKLKALIYHAEKLSDSNTKQSDIIYKDVYDNILTIKSKVDREKLLVEWALSHIDKGRIKTAKKVLSKLVSDQAKHKVRAAIASQKAKNGFLEEGLVELDILSDSSINDKAIADLAIFFINKNDIESSIKAAKAIRNDIKRAKTFSIVARAQAKFNDFYGLIEELEKSGILRSSRGHDGLSYKKEAKSESVIPSLNNVKKFAQETVEISHEKKNDIILRSPIKSNIGLRIPKIGEHYERTLLTAEDVRKQVPASTDIRVHRISVESSIFNHKFILAMGRIQFADLQQTPNPDLIYIEEGVADISAIYKVLRKKNLGDDYLEYDIDNNLYILKKPLVISPKATFTLTGLDADGLLLSKQRGSFIVNAGKMFVTDTEIIGWDEEKSEPAYAEYSDKYEFRPFITAWSFSETNLAGSNFVALGYNNAKSYGLSFSAGPIRHKESPRPKGQIIENSFDNMYYGFYSYEADHISIVGNEYIDNVVYGVDPHDRSRWLTIAYNTAYGSQKKHGIIISREVDNSTIIGNLSFENKGSGLMIDRLSSGSVIYANTSLYNQQDGLTIFESGCKMIASNRLIKNQRAGLKVRNSSDVGIFYNVISNNMGPGIEGYISNLRAESSHITRDFILDPYSTVVAMSVVGNWIENNGMGINFVDVGSILIKRNRFIDQSPKLIRGGISEHVPDILRRFDINNEGVFVTPRCPSGEIVEKDTSCIFRQQGYFYGDGQSNLYERIFQNPCGTLEVDNKNDEEEYYSDLHEVDDHERAMADEERKSE